MQDDQGNGAWIPGDGGRPQTHFAEARGARLAYQKFGSGDHTVMGIPPLAQNIDVAWEDPAIRAMLERFTSFATFIHFDKRGTGASDRRSAVPGIDERVDDIRAVMDAAEIDHAHLFVQSDGGPMALLFAATYPDRVDSLTLFGSFAHNPPPPGLEDIRTRAAAAAAKWGTPESQIVPAFAPSRANDPEFVAWHQRYERSAADTDSLTELTVLSFQMDVRDILADIETPTLVLHRRGDRAIDIGLGREIAEGVPGAEMIEYDGEDHFAYVGDTDEWMSDIERFITGSVAERPRPTTPASAPTVRIVTFGGFDVEIDGRAVETKVWGSRRARQICKRLVATRGWPVTRDQLIDMLWPDETDMSRLSARLSVQLSAVRRVLGGGVDANRDRVRLDLNEVTTDLETFHLATDDEAIVAAYGGEFLPEDRYEDWADGPRMEARQRFVDAALRLADRQPERAIELCGRILTEDPYDEAAHHLRIKRLHADGARGLAGEAYDAYADALGELDVRVPAYDSIVRS